MIFKCSMMLWFKPSNGRALSNLPSGAIADSRIGIPGHSTIIGKKNSENCLSTTDGLLNRTPRPTTRWTGAAVACFVTSKMRRRWCEIAPPGQLRRSLAYNSVATDVSIEDDRTEWDNAWRNRPLRRFVHPIQIDVAPTSDADHWGDVTHIDIVSDPPQYAGFGWRENDICPLCGRTTIHDGSRIAVTIYPYFSKGFSYGRAAWAHESCFAMCEEIPGPAPVPW